MENKCEKCWYYSVTRFGKICSYDGTYNPWRIICPNFTPEAPTLNVDINVELQKLEKSCHNCLWRNYRGQFMMCDNPVVKEQMRTNPKFHTPCEFFELDKTGEDYLIRMEEGYEWIKSEKNLRK